MPAGTLEQVSLAKLTCGLEKTSGLIEDEVVPLDKKKLERTYVVCNDDRLNYTFCKLDDVIENPSLPEIIGRELFDYGIVSKKGEEETEDSVGTLDTIVPISYAGIKTAEQGEDFYREKFPDLPEDFYGIISRYTWGDKTEVESKVKEKTKKKKNIKGLTTQRGKFSVVFD